MLVLVDDLAQLSVAPAQVQEALHPGAQARVVRGRQSRGEVGAVREKGGDVAERVAVHVARCMLLLGCGGERDTGQEAEKKEAEGRAGSGGVTWARHGRGMLGEGWIRAMP